MATSGKCYLSLHENNMSANRGKCYQTCRKSYLVTERRQDMSLRLTMNILCRQRISARSDLSISSSAPGVRVFKIEGRARSAEYVKTVFSCYDEAVRAVADGSYSDEKICLEGKALFCL